ncbi:Flavin reductase [Halorubrum sp. DM2]|uniref:NAD(P)-dependent oxidoreductase n=1 Tax=Halorubrum sp. DM2 TaxID=2527867 RepID=UPI0024B73D03|nr:NAD(P)H-binding protein [Halorubrum sp. DM2]VTT88355.1 Flavin reductase [Halorubrum sp. DM2]
MRIVVFGATGRTGGPLVEQALERGHEVVAFARDPARLSAGVREDARVTVIQGDVTDAADVARAVGGDGDPVDAVVSVLGQTSDGPEDLLTVAAGHLLAAMDEHDVERLVTLVGAAVREEGESVTLGGKVMGALLKLLARAALEDARDHVELVRAGDRRWTVVRAPRLTEGDHTGEFEHGGDLGLGVGDAAARANVADFVLDCLEDDLYVGEMPKVTDAR